MKKTIIILISCFIFSKSFGDTVLVIDPLLIATITKTNQKQYNTLSSMNRSQFVSITMMNRIKQRIKDLKELEKKTQKYLTTVHSVIKDGKGVINAYTIAQDISKYQQQAFNLAKKNPALLSVCVKTEAVLVDRSINLMTYIYQTALKKGNTNMLSNKDRHDFIVYVIDELRVMRSLAYSVSRQIKYAMRAGLLKALNPKTYKWVDDRKKIIEGIRKDYNKIFNN